MRPEVLRCTRMILAVLLCSGVSASSAQPSEMPLRVRVDKLIAEIELTSAWQVTLRTVAPDWATIHWSPTPSHTAQFKNQTVRGVSLNWFRFSSPAAAEKDLADTLGLQPSRERCKELAESCAIARSFVGPGDEPVNVKFLESDSWVQLSAPDKATALYFARQILHKPQSVATPRQP